VSKPSTRAAPQAAPFSENVPARQNQVSAIASAAAPFIFFDRVTNCGYLDGIANFTLEAHRHMETDEGMVHDRVIVGHVRMGAMALASLKLAVAQIEEIMREGSASNRAAMN
jgi:hypothetical protein